MSSTLLRSKVEPQSQPNVFQRLTMKKNSEVIPTTKSSIRVKPKDPISSIPIAPQTSRSTIGVRGFQKNQEKELQKLTLPLNNYTCLTFPVEYAQNGFIIELETQTSENVCKINMNYNQYDILINEIQHHFTMPIMSMVIKTIKVILPEWSDKFTLALSRAKGKVRQDKIETNSFISLVHTKGMIEINPFKQIQQSELRRKKMLLREIPKAKMERVYCKTEMDQRLEKQDLINQQYYPRNKDLIRMKKTQNLFGENSFGSPHRKMIKKDIFNLLTPKSKIPQSPTIEKQKPNKKLSIEIPQQRMQEISIFQQLGIQKEQQKPQNGLKQRHKGTGRSSLRVSENIKALNEMIRSKECLLNCDRV